MGIWIFHLDTVTEVINDRSPSAVDYYYQSTLYDSDFNGCWWVNDGYEWKPISDDQVPPNHRLMALLLT